MKKAMVGRGKEYPKCGQAQLEYLHKKAKKSDCDWKCPVCGDLYRTIKMLKALQND